MRESRDVTRAVKPNDRRHGNNKLEGSKLAHRTRITTRRMMASKALSNQVAAKWQESFNRLNRAVPGISGLMEFSRVRRPFSKLFLVVGWASRYLTWGHRLCCALYYGF
jgi:hypothetical protein